ncbi:MAG: ribonuclease E inhibitor RraB [Pseudomonadota bacterium]|nr:ribonuclease E inhibitor RraB [Pseudomonadota bacterium]
MNRDYATFPDDDNGDVLWRMAQDGDNLGKHREVDFAVIFADESSARKFANQVQQNADKVSVDCYEGYPEMPWEVLVHVVLPPTHAAITAYEAELQSHAELLGGRNDGWGSFQQD